MKRSEEDPFRLKGFWLERVMMGGLALFIMSIPFILAPAVGPEDTGLVIFLYSSLGLILIFPVTSPYRSLTWLYIYQEGIWIHTPFRPDRFLAWGKISRIRSWAWGSSLILSDSTGKIKAGVYSSLKNSHYILGWLMNERPDIWRPADGLTFTKSSVASLLLLAGSVVSLAFAVSFIDAGGSLFWAFPANALAFVILLLLVPHSVSIIGDFLLLRYPFRERVIHADQIRSIEYAHAPPRHVQIRMKEGQIIPLQFFSLGTDMLFGFLWSWHTSKTRPKLGPSSRALVAFRVPPRLLEPPKLNPPMRVDE